MSDGSGEWDRRKAYLVRCLFEDLPRLSPISERRELDQTEDSAEYRHSALPELIIEKERNRHDEPEEFYQELETRMLRLYRKLFFNEHYDSSSMSIGSGVNLDLVEELPYRQDSDDDKSCNNSKDDNVYAADDDYAFEQLIEESFPQDILNSDDDSSEGARYEIITTRALVHAEDAGSYRDVNNNVTGDTVAERSPMLTRKDVPEDLHEMERDLQTPEQLVSTQDLTYAAALSPVLVSRVVPRVRGEETRMIEGLVKTQDTTKRYSHSPSYEFNLYDFSPVEVMRQELSDENPEGSLSELRASRTSAVEREQTPPLENHWIPSPVEKTQSLIEEEIVFEAARSPMTKSDDVHDVLADQTLSPILGTLHRKRTRPADITDKSMKPPRKRIKYKHVESQTNYFCGTPLIYNLCRCKDHVCQ